MVPGFYETKECDCTSVAIVVSLVSIFRISEPRRPRLDAASGFADGMTPMHQT